MNVTLSTAYWPNLHYFFYVLNSNSLLIENFENYQKQSYRNRTEIMTANGVMPMSIPVKKNGLKELSKDVMISYQENWQIKHWRAIESAYKNSPYFDFFEDEIKYFYSEHFFTLTDYNTQQLRLILKILRVKKNVEFTTEYFKDGFNNFIDMRSSIHPKINFREDVQVSEILGKHYYQTFENKFPFKANLSILDLLFNKGLETRDYLIID